MNTETDYRESRSASDAGACYQSGLDTHCYRTTITPLLNELYDGKLTNPLEFACSTGRNQSTGVELSDLMLKKTGKLTTRAELVNCFRSQYFSNDLFYVCKKSQ